MGRFMSDPSRLTNNLTGGAGLYNFAACGRSQKTCTAGVDVNKLAARRNEPVSEA